MRLVLTEEQIYLTSMLTDLFSDTCPPTLVRKKRETNSDGYPAELWTTLAKAGIFGLAVSDEYGGDGAGLFELGLVFKEAGKVLCPTAVYNTLQFSVALEKLGSAEQKQKYLPSLVAGNLKASLQVSNPSDGNDTRPTLVAEREVGGWSISGTLNFVGNGGIADVLLVTALTSAFPAPSKVIGLLVEPGARRVEITPMRSFAGDKLSRIVFSDHFVADDAVVANAHDTGISSGDLTWVANAVVALQCMEMVGGATAVLDATVDYVKVREQFNRPIASFQAVQHHVANRRIALEAARLTALKAVWSVGQGETASREVAIAKMQCSESYKRTTLTAHQLHGGMGYVRETDLHMWSERAKVTEVQYGSADIAAGWLQAELGLVG